MPVSENYKYLTQKLIARDLIAAAGIIEELDENQAVEILAALSPDIAMRVINNLQLTLGKCRTGCDHGFFVL